MSAVVLFCFALGSGVNAGVFSVVYAAFMAPLPFPHAERLVIADAGVDALPYLKRGNVFEELATYSLGATSVRTKTGSYSINAAAVSWQFFGLLGIRSSRGRLFDSRDLQRLDEPCLVVSSAELFVRYLTPDDLGKHVTFGDRDCVLVGVVDQRVTFPGNTQLWLMESELASPLRLRMTEEKDVPIVGIIGRLRAGMSLERAHKHVVWAERQAEAEKGLAAVDAGARSLRSVLAGKTTSAVILVQLAGLCIFAIACANVMCVMFARSVEHEADVTLKLMLGAGVCQATSDLILGAIGLAVVGSGLGMLLAAWLPSLLTSYVPGGFKHLIVPRLDLLIVLMAVAVTAFAAVAVSVVPAAMSVRRLRLGRALSEAGARVRSGVPRVPIAVVLGMQLAACTTLLIAALSVIASVDALGRNDPGFERRGLLGVSLAMPERYGATVRARKWTDLLSAIRRLPEVESAGLADRMPLGSGPVRRLEVRVDGRIDTRSPRERLTVVHTVDPGYFRTIGLRLLAGRLFLEGDAGAPVVVVSESVVRRLSDGGSLLGRCVGVGRTSRWVIGIVGDIEEDVFLKDAESGQIYVPLDMEHAPASGTLVVAVRRPTQADSLAKIAARHDSEIVVMHEEAAAQLFDQALRVHRYREYLLVVLAVVAVCLAAGGVHGTTAWALSRVRREVGIRLALGAQPFDIRRGIVVSSLPVASAGVLVGNLLYYWGTALFGSVVAVQMSGNGFIRVTASLAVLTVTCGMAYSSARRGTRTEPAVLLRCN